MTTTKTTKTAKELISEREIAIAEIKKAWAIICSNNILPIGMMPKFDLNAVYKTITDNESKLIITKISLQLVNLGFTSITDLPKDNLLTSVFGLQQVKERIVKLDMVPTKKEDNETVVLTRSFINDQKAFLAAKKIELEALLETFNDNTNFNSEA